MQTSSRRLRRKIELVLTEYRMPGRRLLAHPRAAELYPQYLARVFYLPFTAVALMQAALRRAKELSPSDPVAGALVPYLEEHIGQELHGEEPGSGVLADLDALGFDTGPLRDGPPPPPKIAALVGAQYFWIYHGHPVAPLGYLKVVEGYHPRREVVEELIERTRLPRDGFRQLLEHADVDVVHSQELDDLLDRLPLTRFQEEVLGLSALQSVELLTEALMEILKRDT
jgi:heme oxygenase-like protein